MTIRYTPIGTIHSPYTTLAGMPIQPAGAAGVMGTVVLSPAYAAGLKDLEGFSHLILLYHLHKSRGCQLEVVPFLDTVSHGIFATRSPARPNPIGLSIVRLREVNGNLLLIENVDILDGTPLIDIKPFVPAFDLPEPLAAARAGWFDSASRTVVGTRADGRFVDSDGPDVRGE
ncbi:MAG TPA: tRNA (N6-threonylcarbamoyladenosine(37)-N6)-methyltransferase TrmO [Geobacteraceae bacterium]